MKQEKGLSYFALRLRNRSQKSGKRENLEEIKRKRDQK